MASISLWIGANDLSREGGWQWSDRSPFAYFNWKSGNLILFVKQTCKANLQL